MPEVSAQPVGIRAIPAEAREGQLDAAISTRNPSATTEVVKDFFNEFHGMVVHIISEK